MTRDGCAGAFSLLWDAKALSKVVSPPNVVSLREFFCLTNSWPVNLPGKGGDALIVAGVEGCLDALNDDDGQEWLETDLKQLILSFQEEYEGQAALILWLPSGGSRIKMVGANRAIFLEEQFFAEHCWAGNWPVPVVGS